MKFLHWIKEEFIELLPAIFYFFIAFSILTINERLILDDRGMSLSSFIRPLIGALLVAKILLVVNFLPIIDLFHGRPLIWNTVWKTLLYWIVGIVFQALESLVHFLVEGQGSAGQQLLAEISSTKFVFIQMWLFILLLLFVAMQELIEELEPGRVRELFFGSKAT